jgi:phosphoserine phosphatase RsbU/P
VARKQPTHLKLHTEDGHSHVQDESPSGAGFDLDRLLDAFTEATGWQPIPVATTPHQRVESAGVEQPDLPLKQRIQLISTQPIDGLLDIEHGFDTGTLVSQESAWALLEQIDELIQQLERCESTIVRQEAQLATSLSVSIRPDESEVLATRLSESLQRVAELTGSDAAALYLLDDTTSELKMRSCWGLPTASLAKPPRPLRGALSDLEALMGNAVMLENTRLAPEWNSPEAFAAAMCVPIGSPTMPHGTMWLWSEHVRDFSSAHIDASKAAADKILADIERSVLADEVLKTRGIDRQLQTASMVQASRLPDRQPLHEDYEIGGWTFQGQALGGNFHTWDVNKHQHLCAALGAAATHGTSGALVACSTQSIVETCWNARHTPAQVMRKANDMLWGYEDGDWRTSLCYLKVDPQTGECILSRAGDIQAFIIGIRGHRILSGTPTHVAAMPDTVFEDQRIQLEAGDLLMLVSSDVVGGFQRGGFSQDVLLDVVSNMHDDSVNDIIDHLARLLPMVGVNDKADFDRSLMLLRRRL